jgi:hypothetical protein
MRSWPSRRRGGSQLASKVRWRGADGEGIRCDLFNKAFNHIAERIDEVYKGLTKGKAAPVGGVAYLSLEDSEVSRRDVSEEGMVC